MYMKASKRAERHTEKRKVLEEKKVDSLKLGKFVLLAIVSVLAWVYSGSGSHSSPHYPS